MIYPLTDQQLLAILTFSIWSDTDLMFLRLFVYVPFKMWSQTGYTFDLWPFIISENGEIGIHMNYCQYACAELCSFLIPTYTSTSSVAAVPVMAMKTSKYNRLAFFVFWPDSVQLIYWCKAVCCPPEQDMMQKLATNAFIFIGFNSMSRLTGFFCWW